MGLFNEESKEEKDYKNLLKIIKSSNKQKEIKDYLIDYVMKIKNEEIKNDFYEFDFLKKVIFTILETNYDTLYELKDELKQLAENVKFFLPEGLEALKNLVLNADAFSKELYALFNNRIDYFQIVNLIINEKVLTQNYNKILDYALKVSPYCINQTILKNEILSFMSGLSKEISDIDLYQEQKLEEAKKRCGIYPVDEKNLVMVADQVRKVQGLIRRLDNIDKKVASYKETIDMLIESGKKELSQNVLKVQEELIKRLDDYLIDLKEMMKHNSDQVFNTFLNEASEKIRVLKLQATTLQNTATSDLLKIKMATEESVETLRKYVEDEPEIKKILKEVSDSSQIKEALLAFKNSQSENIELTPSKREGIIIPGYDRVVVPASPNVIIPKVFNIYNTFFYFFTSFNY